MYWHSSAFDVIWLHTTISSKAKLALVILLNTTICQYYAIQAGGLALRPYQSCIFHAPAAIHTCPIHPAVNNH